MPTNDNASKRCSYVGSIYDVGSGTTKQSILSEINPEWSRLHESGYIHIHDLEAYNLTYNCLTFDLLKSFPYDRISKKTPQRAILETFAYFKEIIVKTANEQSGGMAFANFDSDLSFIIKELGIGDFDFSIVDDSIDLMIKWLSRAHERYGQVSFYVTLNIGLGTDILSRNICNSVLENFRDAGADVIKPNIVFKVKEGVNLDRCDPNYDLYLLALSITSRKMIPTYLLCDCPLDRETDPKNLSVMGCRTRVVNNIFGERSSIGRGNLCNISINLPRLALESLKSDTPEINFIEKWDEVASVVKDILLDRYNHIVAVDPESYPTILEHNLWIGDPSKGMTDVFKNGTLAIGFIGLSDAIEILFGKQYYETEHLYDFALNFVRHMRKYTDKLTEDYNLNFSLLATAGELISGRFPEIDSKLYDCDAVKNGYYTNSFHVRVDNGMDPFNKIRIEGAFHSLCNGGCITYVELESPPIGNEEALDEMIKFGIQSEVHYLGFNFKLDICNDCGSTGINDECTTCGSKNITHIRRVSGYLEDTRYFTDGKKSEERSRVCNRLK